MGVVFNSGETIVKFKVLPIGMPGLSAFEDWKLREGQPDATWEEFIAANVFTYDDLTPEQQEQLKGEDGITPHIGENGNWFSGDVDTNIKAQGPIGVGVLPIEKTGTSGLVDTYTITYTNEATSTFDVTNGKDGDAGENGRSIVNIRKTSTTGNVDTHTITYNQEPLESTFTVKNGDDGVTPSIGTNNNWFIGATDTGIKAIGQDGKTWHFSASNPSNVLGTVGDSHLNTATWDVREKTGVSTWTLRGNIKGPQGDYPAQPTNQILYGTGEDVTSSDRLSFREFLNAWTSRLSVRNLHFDVSDDGAYINYSGLLLLGDSFAQLRFGGASTYGFKDYQLHLGVTYPDPSTIIDVGSSSRGSRPYPSMPQVSRLAIASPAIGLHVYQTDATEGVYVYKSTGWAFAY